MTGHGTAAAGVCVRLGYRVLPVKVSYTAVNGVDLSGLVDACLWIADGGPEVLPDYVLWPFGVTDPESADLFSGLAGLLREHGIQVWASGRGAFTNLGPDSCGQWPSDLPEVVAVDESVDVTECIIRTDRGRSTPAWLVPGSGEVRTGQVYRRKDCHAFASAAHLDAYLGTRPASTGPGLLLAQADLGSFPREPVIAEMPTLLCGAGLGRWTDISIDATKSRIFAPRRRSEQPALLGTTGRLAPVACTLDGYAAVFGSSFALPCALPDRTEIGARSDGTG